MSAASVDEILGRLRSAARPGALEGMARYGIATDRALGVSIPALRSLAREVGPDHRLATRLWATRVHEARILAGMVDDPAKVTERQMDSWARAFDSWDLCDQCCSNLFDRVPFASRKALEWSGREEEFVKRAGFALMAALAVHDKAAPDAMFLGFLGAVEREASDARNYVRKAVNWALRQIGKRNRRLNRAAVATARRIARIPSPAARWVAADALRELTGDAVRRRLG